ncbi:hypothetical protein A2716_03555 [candidate division WWE3 bacterium RIFCSPHIGHO2_01_FULL_40_23]|uniref:DUF4012 domain-containing protein n=1 Tax=candidate division WWE3 bacterium RIFCSPLOWO2_01_FULL_41_18 TaxID=1802625 RepID=A0A1F4VCJ1_UNCKA|nr:MAG: hypothetical protein A2716_03555 [candidate division WWE3 bacterium RIFCSPHIGHO2_01_FULL_40_23]OGC54956.1 MAG: hypothetical protein A3A78_03165 [candidate division WWE3 bacterium RIFCSPLOWO2_01_FULL_41_18]
MGESKFWKPKGFSFNFNNLKALFTPKPKGVPQTLLRKPLFGMSEEASQRFYKKLSIYGGAFLAVAAVIGIILFIFVIKPSYAVIAQVNKIKEDKALLEKEFKLQDVEKIKEALNQLRVDILDLRKVRDGNFPWAKSFAPTKDYFSDSEHFINAGVYAIDAISEFVVVAEPFADAAGFKLKKESEIIDPNAGSGLADAFALWVKVMPEVAEKMDGVIEKADKVGEELLQVDAKRYPENFKGVPIRSNIEASQQYLAKASEFGPDIKAALTIVPPLLGVGQEKRYAIIMQNNAELRATGGFWTNFATFRVRDGKLNSDFTSNDMYSIDDYIALTDTPYTQPWPAPLPPYREYLKVEHTWGRDANYYPDYPTSVDYWMKFYRQAAWAGHPSAKPLNGVFAIDTNVVSELLKVTGPVTLNGFTYDSNNVTLELEKLASLSLREQAGRKKVLGDLMEEMLLNMYKADKNLWPKFTEAAVKLATEKHILVYVFDDPKASELLEKYNFSGRIVNYDKGDYSYVVSTNLGGDKTNIFVTKEVSHKIYQDGGKWMHDVVINYKYGQPMPGYEPLVKVYRDWVRVYAPAGSSLVSTEGSDGSTEADKGEERGKVYFAGHITLPPNESKTITFKYEIPSSLLKDKLYYLYLQKQPGTNNDKHIVTLNGKSQTVELLTDKELLFRL